MPIVVEDGALLGAGRVVEDDLQHEAVDLRLGQRVGAFLLDRVLGRHDQEGLRQRMGLAAEGDLALLHRLEQRALHLGRRPVDFIRQDQVGEYRTVLGLEGAVARVVDHGAHDVRRQHVGRELDALETHRERLRQRLQRQGLAQARHAFEQDMAVGQQAQSSAGRPDAADRR